jgi:hypothetical protein
MANANVIKRGLLLTGVAALFLATGTALAATKDKEYRTCLRELQNAGITKADAKRGCDPKNYVKPTEYGWVCDNPERGAMSQIKGQGTYRKQDAICE